jgi:CheY-like chemotaxis protein
VPLRIVVCDDQPAFRMIVSTVLRLEPDVEVVGEGGDGRQAIELALRLKPDVLLLDIAMPVMDGLEATRRIRARENGGEEVPIIALTAHAMDGIIEQCLDTGMDDYLAKPVTRESLAAALRRWIEPETAALRS